MSVDASLTGRVRDGGGYTTIVSDSLCLKFAKILLNIEVVCGLSRMWVLE